MSESRGCCHCCCSFITTLGLTAFFLWLSLRTSNPKCSIESFYLPALNKTLNSTITATPSNTSLNFFLQLANPNKDKGIYYDALNLTFMYVPPNTSAAAGGGGGGIYQVIGNMTLPAFYQGHKKTAKRKDNSVDTREVDWKSAFGAVLSNKTVVFRVNLTTAVRFKIMFWKTKRHKINVGEDVEVNDLGAKIKKKGIRLKSGAPQLGCYRAPVVGALVIFSFYILNFLY